MAWTAVVLICLLSACQPDRAETPRPARAAEPQVAATPPPDDDADARGFAVQALAAEQTGDYDRAFGLHREAAALCQGVNGPRPAGACPAIAQYQIGLERHTRRDMVAALQHYRQAAAVVPDDFVALRAAIADRLGDVAVFDGRNAAACAHYAEAFSLHLDLGRRKNYRACPDVGRN